MTYVSRPTDYTVTTRTISTFPADSLSSIRVNLAAKIGFH